jgi:hypothetical protein
MTKDELVAFAKEGKAHIEACLTCIVTRYRVTEQADDDSEESMALFISICDEGTIHDAYVSGAEEDAVLTADEIEVLRTATATVRL